MKLGMQGDDIKALQQCLLDMGFPNAYGADGWYGTQTYLQITEYQRSQGLQYIDGVVGPETASALTCKPEGISSNVEMKAEVLETEGGYNDRAQFFFGFDLDIDEVLYLSENAEEAIDFYITDMSTGTVIYDTQNDESEADITLTLWTSGLRENGYYMLSKDNSERAELTVIFNPYGETAFGYGSYSVQLTGINFKTEPNGTSETRDVSEEAELKSNVVDIIN